MNFSETLEFLFNSLPQFQRVGAPAYKAGLLTSETLDERFGYPSRAFRSVHVAGTNGKGSTCQMIYEALMAAGYSVGIYTSPHLTDFRERIIVDRKMISKEAVVDFTAKLMDIKDLKPSFFEMTVAMAFDYFRNMNVDYAVVEVGMGGRLDSTNIITPRVSVITNISLDHMQFLGSTIPAIASEKAGIIKPLVPVVIGETQAECQDIFKQRAKELNSPIFFADTLLKGRHYQTAMEGFYQKLNTLTAAATLEVLGIDDKYIREGVARARVAGRWQVLGHNPLIVCDTGHNEAGIRFVASQIAAQTYEKLYFVLGVVADKDIEHILPLLPPDAHYIFTQADIERAMPCQELARRATAMGLHGEIIQNITSALACAKKLASPHDMIFIGGSTFTVASATPVAPAVAPTTPTF